MRDKKVKVASGDESLRRFRGEVWSGWKKSSGEMLVQQQW